MRNFILSFGFCLLLCSCAHYPTFQGEAVYRDDFHRPICGLHCTPLVSVTAFGLDDPKTILDGSEKRIALDKAFPNAIQLGCFLEPDQYYHTPRRIEYCVECERHVEEGLK